MSPLNPYFLQGSESEQRLVQDLINEQLRMYGQDVVYLPRHILNQNNIIKEVTSSKFNDSFRIEAYLLNYDGFGGQGDILSKFGVRTTDEITLLISKERYEDFISPFIGPYTDIKVKTRPEEGDLIYFPLDNSLFEIKYVEGKKPFYQLNNLYVYQLSCEIFEYEDEIIDTTIEEVDASIKEFGYIQTLKMVPTDASNASAQVPLSILDNSVSYIDLINDGTGYLTTPTITIEKAPEGGTNATAVAIMTTRTGRRGYSIDRILIINPGSGYIIPPKVSIKGSTGSGGIATAIISSKSLGSIGITSFGYGFSSPPIVSISSAPFGGINAAAESFLNPFSGISTIRYSNAGSGYTVPPTITIESPIGISTGSYYLNQIVKGLKTNTTAIVKDWNAKTRILKVSNINGEFSPGESIVGIGTSIGVPNAIYKLEEINLDNIDDPYVENASIQEESDNILDSSENNSFGYY